MHTKVAQSEGEKMTRNALWKEAVTEWEDQKDWMKSDGLAATDMGPCQDWFMDAEDHEDLLIQLRTSGTPIVPTTQSQMCQKHTEPMYFWGGVE